MHDEVVDLEARDISQHGDAEAHSTWMGETLDASVGDTSDFQVHLTACPQAKVYLFVNGIQNTLLPPLDAGAGDSSLPFRWTMDGNAHCIRIEVRDANCRVILVSNPVSIHPLVN